MDDFFRCLGKVYCEQFIVGSGFVISNAAPYIYIYIFWGDPCSLFIRLWACSNLCLHTHTHFGCIKIKFLYVPVTFFRMRFQCNGMELTHIVEIYIPSCSAYFVFPSLSLFFLFRCAVFSLQHFFLSIKKERKIASPHSVINCDI